MTPAEELVEKLSGRNGRKHTRDPCMWKDRCTLKSLRESLGLGISNVAKAVGISPQAMYVIEEGSNPVLSNAIKLAKFYGKPVEEIWT